MWAHDRHQRILAMLDARGQVGAQNLADLLGVSRETIRRDLLDLDRAGRVRRVHGGAVLPEAAPEAPFANRMTTHLRAKREIARKAVGLIGPGQCVMIDAGSTTAIFAQELARLSGITVITNSLAVANTVQGAGGGIDLLLLGGRMFADVPATFGELTLSEIARFRADLAFVAPVAVDLDGAHDFALHEPEVARAMSGRAGRVAVLADRSKLGRASRVRCIETGRIGALVTDGGADAGFLAGLRGRGIEVIA